MGAWTLDMKSGHIAVLSVDLPGRKVNTLSSPVMDELSLLLDGLVRDRAARALVIASGKPDGFIAGADIAEIRGVAGPARAEELSRRGQALCRKVEQLPFPTAAAVHGACLGGGLELALACGTRVVSDDPRTLLGLPEVTLGIIPGFGGTQRLPRLIGLSAALDLILGGKPVDAGAAKQLGLADAVVPRDSVLDAAVEAARRASGMARTVRSRSILLARLRDDNPLLRGMVLRKARGAVLAGAYGNTTAPLAALDAVRAGYFGGPDAGFASEAKLFGGLASSEEARRLIDAFFGRNAPPPP